MFRFLVGSPTDSAIPSQRLLKGWEVALRLTVVLALISGLMLQTVHFHGHDHGAGAGGLHRFARDAASSTTVAEGCCGAGSHLDTDSGSQFLSHKPYCHSSDEACGICALIQSSSWIDGAAEASGLSQPAVPAAEFAAPDPLLARGPQGALGARAPPCIS